MKKNFLFYTLIWCVLFAAINVVLFFVSPICLINYDEKFWIAWVFVFISFIGNFVLAYRAFYTSSLKKTFYRVSLVNVSWSAMISTTVICSILMLIPGFPLWLTSIVCFLVFGLHTIAILKVLWAVDIVEEVDKNVNRNTAFIESFTANIENMLVHQKNEEVREECIKVYEALRYSDPISGDSLSAIETQIGIKMDELSAAVESNEIQTIKEIANQLLALIGSRNQKCKLLK